MFKEIIEMLLVIVFCEGGSSIRIDVVFDNYRELLIKNLEREKRGVEIGVIYRSIYFDYCV